MSAIRILLADDHQMFRAGIGNLLRREAEFEIAGEAGTGPETVRLALHLKAPVILMDIHLPELDGIAATKQILAGNPDAKILALSSFEDEESVLKMVKAGAKGFVLKESPYEELVLAIKTISTGGSYFCKAVSDTLFSHLEFSGTETSKKLATTLTQREIEVLRFVAEEMTNKEIAARLFISPRTVETHRRNIIQKLKVKNTAGLVKFYLGTMDRGR